MQLLYVTCSKIINAMFSKETYINRRKRLADEVGNGVILLLGNSEASCNYEDNPYIFRQDSSFLYFFGLDKPDLAAVIDTESGEEVIYGNDVDIDDIVWMGPQPMISDQAAEVGMLRTAPLDRLGDYLSQAAAKGRKIHYLPPYRNHNKIMVNRLLGIPFDELKEKSSVTLIKAIAAQRLIKTPEEIEQIDLACNLGYTMHLTAMRMMRTGMIEQELVGIMEGVVRSGGYMISFPTILSQHGEILHNHAHEGILTEGKICVIDAGAEIASHYCSDNTRTLPCSGKFTQKQADIYNIVVRIFLIC